MRGHWATCFYSKAHAAPERVNIMTTLEIIVELDRCRTMLVEAQEAGDDTGERDIKGYIAELAEELHEATK